MRELLGAATAMVLLACPTPPRTDAGTETDAGLELDAGPPCDGGQRRNHLGECLVSADTPGFDCEANPIWVPFPPEGGLVTLSGDPRGFPSSLECHFPEQPHIPSVTVKARGVSFLVNLGLGGVLRAWVDEPEMNLSLSQVCPFPSWCPQQSYDPTILLGPSDISTDFAATRHLWVSGPGPFTAHFRRSPKQREQCAHATEVVLDDAGVARFTDDLANHFDRFFDPNDQEVSRSDGPIALYRLRLSADSNVAISGQFPDGARLMAFTPDCVEAWTAHSPLLIRIGRGEWVFGLLAPGRKNEFPIPYTLEVRATPEPPSSCANPVALTFVSDGGVQVARFSGTTEGLSGDFGPGCVVAGAWGPNQAFTFTTSSPLNVEALVSTTDPSFQPAVSLRAGSCIQTDAVCDVAIVPGAAARVTGNLIPAGAYFLAVGSQAASHDGGVFDLRVTLSP